MSVYIRSTQFFAVRGSEQSLTSRDLLSFVLCCIRTHVVLALTAKSIAPPTRGALSAAPESQLAKSPLTLTSKAPRIVTST